jgi:hypothetical protein
MISIYQNQPRTGELDHWYMNSIYTSRFGGVVSYSLHAGTELMDSVKAFGKITRDSNLVFSEYKPGVLLSSVPPDEWFYGI